jgi:hypothetical protein
MIPKRVLSFWYEVVIILWMKQSRWSIKHRRTKHRSIGKVCRSACQSSRSSLEGSKSFFYKNMLVLVTMVKLSAGRGLAPSLPQFWENFILYLQFVRFISYGVEKNKREILILRKSGCWTVCSGPRELAVITRCVSFDTCWNSNFGIFFWNKMILKYVLSFDTVWL